MHTEILSPVVALIAWTLVMLVWTMAVRLPALKKAGIDMSKASGGHPGILDGKIPDKAQWPAHNYIHLVEQPTLFYAVCFALALLGQGDGMNATIAWIYVGLRVLHSLVQATFNKISIRFLLFVLSTLALMALTLHAGIAILHDAPAPLVQNVASR
ncbi:MAG: MAPEG family protein [Sphingomonas sp.]|uniref:MAPEG family protein n=1 Tax=Sphingomonas sp. TaxID=28214 RepID=UPI0025FFEB2F|nr:MAPEG family protein [Sphingomonas sp.]MBX3565039.1 MAPEG family protein [Sphingomonas sp.]